MAGLFSAVAAGLVASAFAFFGILHMTSPNHIPGSRFSNFVGHMGRVILKPLTARFYNLPEAYYNNTFHLSELVDEVTVYRDNLGIPYVFSKTDREAFFSQGFLHATERLWQMEQMRRLYKGTLSEIIGEDTLAFDLYARSLLIEDVVKQRMKDLDKKEYDDWQAYADGVNAGMKSLKGMQFEFALLRIKKQNLQPWTVEDSVGVFTITAIFMTCGGMAEISKMMLDISAPKYSEEFYIKPLWPVEYINDYGQKPKIMAQGENNELSVPDDVKMSVNTEWSRVSPFTSEEQNTEESLSLQRDKKLLAAIHKMPAKSFPRPFPNIAGSNAWAISGKYTKSGKPVLAGDPHLELTAPGFFVPISLNAEELSEDVSEDGGGRAMRSIGVSIAGFLGLIIGHNDKVAWSVTLSFLDQEDYFVVEIDPTGKKYIYDGKHYDLKFSHIEISTKEGKKYKWTVRATHHGPIMSDVQPLLLDLAKAKKTIEVPDNHEIAVAFASTALRAPLNFDMPKKLVRASSYLDILRLARETQTGSFSVVAADVEGNIGSFVFGSLPRRTKVNESLFREGNVAATDWKGIREWDDMPYLVNPKRGFVFSSNGPQAPDTKKIYGSHFDSGLRAQKIVELLKEAQKSNEPVNVDTFRQMQLNTELPYAGCRFKSVVQRRFASSNPCGDLLSEKAYNVIKTQLVNWDCSFDVKSVAATFYDVWLQFMAQRLFSHLGIPDEGLRAFQGAHFLDIFGHINEFHSNWMPRMVEIASDEQHFESRFFQGKEKQLPWLNFVCESAQSSHTFLRNRYGSNMKDWQWGIVRQHRLPNPLCLIPVFKHLFCPGPVIRGGATNVINAMTTPPHILDESGAQEPSKYHEVQEEASMRMVVDLGDLGASKWVVPPGVSGWVGSPHYSDQLRAHTDGELFEMLWEKEDIIERAVTKMRLSPKSNPQVETVNPRGGGLRNILALVTSRVNRLLGRNRN